MTDLTVLKTDKRLIDKGHYYLLEGDPPVSGTKIDVTGLDKPLDISGELYIQGYSYEHNPEANQGANHGRPQRPYYYRKY